MSSLFNTRGNGSLPEYLGPRVVTPPCLSPHVRSVRPIPSWKVSCKKIGCKSVRPLLRRTGLHLDEGIPLKPPGKQQLTMLLTPYDRRKSRTLSLYYLQDVTRPIRVQVGHHGSNFLLCTPHYPVTEKGQQRYEGS